MTYSQNIKKRQTRKNVLNVLDNKLNSIKLLSSLETEIKDLDSVIDPKELSPASVATIKYGDGNVYFESNGEPAIIEMDYIGSFKGSNKLGLGWYIKTTNKKIIIYSKTKSHIKDVLFTYIGSLTIINCRVTNWNRSVFYAKRENLDKSYWNVIYSKWNSYYNKPEETKNKKIINRAIKKTII